MARTKEFDQDAVIEKAMRLFWEQGYEKTSMKDLVAHMGIHKGSMYDTFGDKQALYFRALDRYADLTEQAVLGRVAEARSAKEAIRMLLEATLQADKPHPDGCFIVNTAVELAKHDPEAKDRVLRSWSRTEQWFRDLIARGRQSGELGDALDTEGLAASLMNAYIGLTVMAKTITDRDKLRAIIDMHMKMLD
ncbi:TetR/AcrR family transcriptional regulator [Paenibacillus sp. MWE-103]|uniref:TetR/AcrR family transcriptional regulator n=1 Tax=Paenibacillus artemisiicola TaxID=1172618 RepID=A0ABS3W3Z4_9BACL|nr:TetR/AcrR family transcriptional regulator [Paenibacillus artemisiicola]MBO7743013.1 TetR/AcrR family transcriptional regulator [Paenibacillus artemisiicola]